MKKLYFLFFAVALFVTVAQIAQAFQVTLTAKQITVQFVITPSPTPVGYQPGAAGQAVTIAQQPAAALPMLPPIASMVAYSPYSLGDMVVAQATPQSSVKVQFTVKPDPNYAYFHIIPGASTTFNAGYGSNTFTCAFQVYAHYSTTWTIYDYTYGSNTTGGTAGFNGFPTYNYPTTSLLSWLAETQTTVFKAYSNGGTPGETSFPGAAGSTKTICMDLQLSVPSNIAAGTYSVTLNYYMTHS